MLYARWFREEFLPFLTQKRMKLDFKYSLDRDGFYARFQEVERKLDHSREENARIAEGAVGRELELEMRKRIMKLKREMETTPRASFTRCMCSPATSVKMPPVKRGQMPERQRAHRV